MMSKVYTGVESFMESFTLLKNDRVIRNLSLIPMLMSVVLFTVGLTIGVFYLDRILSWVTERHISDYDFFIKSLVYVFSFVVLTMIAYLAAIIVVSILAVPVCTVIAQKTLESRGWRKNHSLTLKHHVLSALRLSKISFQKFFVLLAVSAALLIASLLPIISPLSLYFSFMIMSFDAIDYALELEEMSFSTRLKYFKDHFWEMSGLSVCLMGLAVVPVVHILFLPVSVISASILYGKITEKLRSRV